jgi:hypothetical protein
MQEQFKRDITNLSFLCNGTQNLRGVSALFKQILQNISPSSSSSLEYYKSIIYNIIRHSIQNNDSQISYLLLYELCESNFVGAYTVITDLSWKHICRFCDFIRNIHPYGTKHPVILYCIRRINSQLYMDKLKLALSHTKQNVQLSNVAKWIPRENSKYAWLFHALAFNWASIYTPYLVSHNNTITQSIKNKIYMNYRKVCSRINNYLGTIETHLCNPHLRESGLLGSPRYTWASTFTHHRRLLQMSILHTLSAIPKRKEPTICSPPSLRLMSLLSPTHIRQHPQLNYVWESMASRIRLSPSYILPIIDTSLYMCNRAIHYATYISLAISENSNIRNRILAMGNQPIWIKLPADADFVTSATKIREVITQENTIKDIDRCMKLIIQSFLSSGMSSLEIEQVCLVILSDMQFGNCDGDMHKEIKRMFAQNNIPVIPHIVYWGFNVNSDTPLPCKYNEPRTTLISGGSFRKLQYLQNMEYASRRKMTPYDAVCTFTK